MKLEELRKIRENAAKDLNLRSGKARVKIIVSMGTSGIAAGAREVLSKLLDEVIRLDLKDVVVTQSGERGYASFEPVVEVHEEGKPTVIYGNMTPAKAKRVITEHIVNGKPVTDYAIEVKE